MFRAVVAEIVVLRTIRNKQVKQHKRKGRSLRRDVAGQRAQLATAHSQVDEALSRAAALSANIRPQSLTPPVANRQWQPCMCFDTVIPIFFLYFLSTSPSLLFLSNQHIEYLCCPCLFFYLFPLYLYTIAIFIYHTTSRAIRPHVQAWLSWSERGTVNP